jgi:MFS transporter, CP family, cyanate transporter
MPQDCTVIALLGGPAAQSAVGLRLPAQHKGTDTLMEHAWRRIAWLYALGVLAAAQLGKMSALAPLIANDLVISLTMAGILISLLEIGGATLGFAAGLLVDRLGVARVLRIGIALLVVANLGESLSPSLTMLIAWRICEGAAYLSIVIAAPLLIFRTAQVHSRTVALALWSSFVPVGFALGAMGSGLIADLFSWRAAALVWAVIAGLMALFSSRMAFAPSPSGDKRRLVLPNWRIWALTLAFGCWASFAVGTIALLPSFLVDRVGASARMAGLVGGLSAFISVLGVALAAWLRHHGARTGAWMTVSIVVPALMLFGVFNDAAGIVQVTVLMLALNTISGVYSGLAFALLPVLARTDAEMAVANGLTLQLGATGSLLGPPLFAACVEQWGWAGAASAGALMSTLCLGLMQAARPATLAR